MDEKKPYERAIIFTDKKHKEVSDKYMKQEKERAIEALKRADGFLVVVHYDALDIAGKKGTEVISGADESNLPIIVYSAYEWIGKAREAIRKALFGDGEQGQR